MIIMFNIPGLTSFIPTFTSLLSRIGNILSVALRTAASFPKVDEIMGLPPRYFHSEYDFNVIDQIETNFPILHITPLNLKAGSKEGGQNVTISEIATTFKYAVQVDNSISINHTNTYAQAQLTNDLKQSLEYNVVRDLNQMSKIYTGYDAGDMTKLLGDLANSSKTGIGESVGQVIESIVKGNAGTGAGTAQKALAEVGSNVLALVTQGARVDFPNIWQDSQTGMSHSFTIELRTFATDPDDPEYIKDIIQPLEVLLHLALPLAESSMAYVEPPYIKAHIDNVFEIRLGGITNMSWSIPLSTLNLRGVPRHIQINLTMTDLYNVMVNSKDDSQSAEKAPTLQKFIKHLKKSPNRSDIANEHIWMDEFNRGAVDQTIIDYETRSADSGRDEKKTPSNDAIIQDSKIPLNKILPDNIKQITLNYSNGNVMIYHDEKLLTSLNNIKDIKGLDLSKVPIDIDLTKQNIDLILN